MAEAEGIPPTASVVVPGLSLNYVAEYAYAYSGMHNVAASNVEHLAFTSGSGIIIGTISCMGSVDLTNPALGGTTMFTITFNGVNAFKVKAETSAGDMPTVQTIPIIIPPFTLVEVNVDSNNAAAGLETSVTIAGRVYDV